MLSLPDLSVWASVFFVREAPQMSSSRNPTTPGWRMTVRRQIKAGWSRSVSRSVFRISGALCVPPRCLLPLLPCWNIQLKLCEIRNNQVSFGITIETLRFPRNNQSDNHCSCWSRVAASEIFFYYRGEVWLAASASDAIAMTFVIGCSVDAILHMEFLLFAQFQREVDPAPCKRCTR